MDPLNAFGAGLAASHLDPVTGARKPATPEEIATAAQQFEGLLIHQLLKSGTPEGGWMGTGEGDSAGLQAMDLAQEQFAAALASRGGLGLAKLIAPQLTATAAKEE